MKQALIFWFTGLSGAGKSTLAEAAKGILEKDGYSVLVLDGDDIRNRLHVNLGFSSEDIKENNSLILELCHKYQYDYDAIFVPIISPYQISRERARASLGKRFFEIHISVDLDTVIKRDTKGFYAKAKAGVMDNLIGYSDGSVYEAPLKPELQICTDIENTNISIQRFYQFALQQLTSHRSCTCKDISIK